MPMKQRSDPYGAFNFLVEIDGVTKAGFAECTGLSADTTVIEYREGSDPTRVRKLVGLTRYAQIILVRGLTSDKSLCQWFKDTIDGKPLRTDGAIVLLGSDGTEVARWNFHAGWPSKWRGPAFNAKSNEVAIETLEITHEGFEWV